MKRNELTWAVAADAIILGLMTYWFAGDKPSVPSVDALACTLLALGGTA